MSLLCKQEPECEQSGGAVDISPRSTHESGLACLSSHSQVIGYSLGFPS